MSTKVDQIKIYKNGSWQDITKVHDGSNWKQFRGVYHNGVWYEIRKWFLINSDALWSDRAEFSSVIDSNDNIYVMGGYNSGNDTSFNDVYKSTDGGSTWTEVTSSALWSERDSFASVIDSNDNIYVMGGYNYGNTLNFNDVYKSTDGGSTWTEVTPSALWSERGDFQAVIDSNDNIYVMGGYNNDVYKSTDGGSTWTEVTPSALWSERGGFQAVIDSNDNIYVMGGYDSSNDTFLNDVYKSTDGGSTWTEVTSSALWSERSDFQAVIDLNDNIYVMGGEEATFFDDVYESTDGGSTWTQITSDAEWIDRARFASIIDSNNYIYIMGGFVHDYYNDVWKYYNP